MRRKLLGLTALVLLTISGGAWFLPPLEPYRPAAGPLLRIGMVLGIFWLAWPDLERLPRWTWFALPILLAALIYARGVLLYLLPGLAAAFFAYIFYRKLRRPA